MIDVARRPAAPAATMVRPAGRKYVALSPAMPDGAGPILQAAADD